VLHRNALCAVALLTFSGFALALDIGFESFVSASASDNVQGANAGSEEEGQVGYAQFGVFGEQKGTVVRGAFAGELYSRKQLDNPDDEFSGVTQFLGAAEIKITPRALSWYVGDILGGVRTDDALQPIDDLENTRRNVFATGPRFQYDIDAFSRVNARFLYVNQTQNDVDLETLYNTSASWEIDTSSGNTWGLQLANIFTDHAASTEDEDFNRFSLSGFWRRERGRNEYEAAVGGTRYDVEQQSLDGANARFTFRRRLTQQTNFSVSLTRDLRDQTLTAVESLLTDGTGRQASGDGFFDETRADVRYDFTSEATTFDVGVGIGSADFRLLSNAGGQAFNGNLEDRTNLYASASYGYRFNTRNRILTSVSLEAQDYTNREDNTQSVLGVAQYIRRLGRSFELELGYRVSVSEGLQTRAVTDSTDRVEEDIDITENRVTIGLRWAPPTRASRDLTIELNSLLQ